MLGRRRSSRLDAERQAVEQQVEDAFKLQTKETDIAPLRRRSSAYLPPNLPATESNMRVAKHVIQDVYTLQECYDRQHMIENVACGAALVGILIVILDTKYIENQESKLVLRAGNVVLTVLLLGLIIWRFLVEKSILVRRKVLPPNISLIGMPKQLLLLGLELGACAMFVPPGINGTFDVREWKYYIDTEAVINKASSKTSCGAPFVADHGSCYLVYSYPLEVLGLLSLLRLYMIPRVIRNLSSVASYHTSYLGTLHRVDTMSPLFAIKCFLRSHPFRLLLAAFLSTLVLTSYALAIVEAPVNPSLAPFANAVWLVALTMATVGYGDIVPITFAGQTLLVFGGMTIGILLVAALSAALFVLLQLDDQDKRFIHSIQQQQYDWKLKQTCVRTIQAAWRRHQGAETGSRYYKKLCNNLFKTTFDQRQLRKNAISGYTCLAGDIQIFRDNWMKMIRQEQAAVMKRLHRVENRLDSLLGSTNTAVSGAS